MAGFDAPYVPGWDCHGLPIELNVEREKGAPDKDRVAGRIPAGLPRVRGEVRRLAARRLQAARHPRRLGRARTSRWRPPTRRPSSARSASSSPAGSSTRARSRCYWCLRDRTALAEAEVEYETHTSPSIYVEFPLSPADAGDAGARVPALAGRDVTVLIWTTTPWTIPSNLAIAFHPDFDYARVPEPRAAGERLARRDPRRGARRRGGRGDRPGVGRELASFKGEVARGRRGSGIRSTIAIRSACWRSTSRSSRARAPCTPRPATAPTTSRPACATGSTSTRRSAPTAASRPTSASSAASRSSRPTRSSKPRSPSAAGSGSGPSVAHSYPHCWRCHQPVIFLATSQWFISMDGLREAAVCRERTPCGGFPTGAASG